MHSFIFSVVERLSCHGNRTGVANIRSKEEKYAFGESPSIKLAFADPTMVKVTKKTIVREEI